MIGAKHVLTSLEEELAALELHPEACLRQPTLAQAAIDCHACGDVCPHDALELDPLSVNEDACDHCVACVEVCPSTALTHASSLRRDLFVALARVEEGKRFRVTCPLAEGAHEAASVRVACVAGLPWEAPIVALLRGAGQVEVVTGDCMSCERRALEPQVDATVSAISRAAQALKLPPVVHTEPSDSPATERSPTRDGRVSRRGLFDGLLRRGKSEGERAGAKGVERLTRAVDANAGSDETVDTLWLRRLLGSSLRRRSTAVESIGLPRAARLEVTSACAPCPLCASACPTQALHAKLDVSGSRELSITPELCTACGACVVSCPEGAIRIESLTELATWGRRRSLITRRPDSCHHCGEPALSSELPYCGRCYREGHAAHHLPR
jgi:ferredoxin